MRDGTDFAGPSAVTSCSGGHGVDTPWSGPPILYDSSMTMPSPTHVCPHMLGVMRGMSADVLMQ